jgi:hypothetical protein
MVSGRRGEYVSMMLQAFHEYRKVVPPMLAASMDEIPFFIPDVQSKKIEFVEKHVIIENMNKGVWCVPCWWALWIRELTTRTWKMEQRPTTWHIKKVSNDEDVVDD